MNKKLLAGFVFVAALAAAWWVLRMRGAEDGNNQVLHGNVDIREVNLGFRVPGRIASLACDEGSAVKPGDILARLDDEPYRREVDEAVGQVASAQAHLNLLQAGYRPQEVAQARAAVREREVTFINAERLFNRQQDLLSAKAVSIQDRDDSEARFREAEARLKSAREQLTLLEAGYRAEDIAAAKGDLSRAQALLKSAELRLEDTVLKSPSEGEILTRAQEPGSIVAAGATVLTVSLRNPVWVRAYIHETDRIHTGTKVQVFADNRPGQPYSGTIGFISPRAEFTPKNVETEKLRTSLVYRLRITVTDADKDLRQGMPVTVKVLPD